MIKTPTINIYNGDCMKALEKMPDNAFDLAIVDPPYGIKMHGVKESSGSHGGRKGHAFKNWDNERPPKKYFTHIKRVSKNQIIWGANYYPEYLEASMCWLCWRKNRGSFSSSDFELAYTSFNTRAREFTKNPFVLAKEGGTIHPTQKPIILYKWLLKNYAKEGDKILDTHLGSGSIAIACHDMGFDLEAYELDTDYYNGAMKRLNDHRKQLKLFI